MTPDSQNSKPSHLSNTEIINYMLCVANCFPLLYNILPVLFLSKKRFNSTKQNLNL